LAAVALGGLGLLVAAAGAAAEDAAAIVTARVAHFRDIGRAAHVVQIEVGKPSADTAAVGEAARKIEGLASEIPSWFPAGSGPESGATTQARPQIWVDPAGFQARAAALGAAAKALEAAAAASDQGGVKSGFMTLAQACQGCHNAFRTAQH